MKNLHLDTYLALAAIGKKKIVSLLVAVLMVFSFAAVSYAANSPAIGYNATGIYAWRWTRTDIAIGVYADPGLYQWIGSWNPGTQVWIERRLDNVKTSAGDTVSIAETGGAFGHKYAYVRAAELITTPQTTTSQTQKPSWVTVAINEIGNDYSKYNKWIGTIGNSYVYSWCGSFANWCLSAAGNPNYTKTASCLNMWDYYNGKGLIKTKSSGYTPKPGDLIFFDWGGDGKGDPNKYEHVEIVEYVDSNGIHTIGGNTGSGSTTTRTVRRVTRSNNNEILGYAAIGK